MAGRSQGRSRTGSTNELQKSAPVHEITSDFCCAITPLTTSFCPYSQQVRFQSQEGAKWNPEHVPHCSCGLSRTPSAVISLPQETSSDGPRTPSVKARSRSLHLVLRFEDEQIVPPKPKTEALAARISARQISS